MAADGTPEVEMNAHRSSYSLFIGLVKWGTIISFLAAALVIFIIVS